MSYRITVLSLWLAFLAAESLLAQDLSDDDSFAPSAGEINTPLDDTKQAGATSQDSNPEKRDDKLGEIAKRVDQDPTAQQATKSILAPIYEIAEYLSFAGFHWVAFLLMVAGLVSYGLQLILGKLIALMQFHFSPVEILSDGLGFLISAVGLVLTTQAATENSTFTQSPAAVLSSAAVGIVLGLVFYVRGQTQEFREAREVRRRRTGK